jgi:excisionase family DNA binding protein
MHQVYATPVQGEDFYTVEEAAQALKLTPDRIRQMLRDGELEGVPPREGGASGWKIPIRVIHGRDRPPIDLSESPTTGPESSSGTEDISDPGDIRGEEEPGPTPAQPQRDDAAENSREPTAPSTYHVVTVQGAAHILETSVDALLEAKDEAIADLRDRVAFLERQLEGRAEEIRRRDHIIAALTERIPPAIEAPKPEKPPRDRESTAEESARVAPSSAEGTRTGSERPRDTAEFPVRGSLLRPWWRRVFRR